MEPKLYIINVVGCTEPEKHGPYDNDEVRIDAAREIFDEEDCIMRLDIDKDGVPHVESFSNREMDADEEEGDE